MLGLCMLNPRANKTFMDVLEKQCDAGSERTNERALIDSLDDCSIKHYLSEKKETISEKLKKRDRNRLRA